MRSKTVIFLLRLKGNNIRTWNVIGKHSKQSITEQPNIYSYKHKLYVSVLLRTVSVYDSPLQEYISTPGFIWPIQKRLI